MKIARIIFLMFLGLLNCAPAPGDRQVHGASQRRKLLALFSLAGKDGATLDDQFPPGFMGTQPSEQRF